MTDAAAATIARKCWRTLEPYHGMIYLVPEAAEEYSTIGVEGRSGYFGSRSAPMGAVATPVVEATFYNFDPGVVARAMDGLWDRTTPGDLVDARHRAADRALPRLVGDDASGEAVVEALGLIRPVVRAAVARPEGRPLFAGHAHLAEPEAPHLALWWAITLLREFRGDGHVAALVDAELSGLDALLLHGASGEIGMDVLQATRGWSDEEWAAGLDSLAERGLIDDGALTDRGRMVRQHVESRTDVLAAVAWQVLDEGRATRLRQLVRPLSKAIVDGGFGAPSV